MANPPRLPPPSRRNQNVEALIRQKETNGPTKRGRGRPRKSMSIDDILGFVPYEPDAVNSRFVRCTSIKKDRTHGGYKIMTTTRIPGEDAREHFQSVKPVDPDYSGPISQCPAVLVDCTCKRFLFQWEYALAHRGAAQILRGNGKPPYVKNPRLIPACCKHLLRGLLNLKVRGL